MKELIASEWYKLLRSRAFLLILAGVTVTSILSIQGNISREDMGDLTDAGLEELAESGFLLGHTGVNLISMSSMFVILWIAAFAGFFAASEFQNRTVCNVLALGKERTHVFLAKLFALCLGAAVMLAVVGLVGTVGATLAFGFGDVQGSAFISYLFVYFFMQLYLHAGFAAVFCTIAFISRNVGLTILLSIAYLIVTLTFTAFVGQFESLAFIQKLFPYGYIHYMTEYKDQISAFFPMALAAGAVHIILPCVVGCGVFRKADIV